MMPELPPEILCDIFDIVVNFRYKWHSVLDICFSLLNLQLVCKYWRRIALSAPRLWASTHVQVDSVGHAFGSVAMLQTFIERSKTVPLDVTYECHIKPLIDPSIASISAARELLRPELYRLSSFTYIGPMQHLRIILDSPSLDDVTTSSGSNPSNSLSKCTAIRKLSVFPPRRDYASIPARFPRLHEFETEGSSDHVPRVIAHAPQLVHLVVGNDATTIIRPITVEWPQFPHLRTLTWNLSNWREMLPTLRTSPHIVALRGSAVRGLCSFLRLLENPQMEPAADGVHDSLDAGDGEDPRSELFIPALQHLDILHYPYFSNPIESGEDHLSHVPSLLRRVLHERPKFIVRVWEMYTPLNPSTRLDINELQRSSKEYPERALIHPFAPMSLEVMAMVPLSWMFPCQDVITELKKQA